MAWSISVTLIVGIVPLAQAADGHRLWLKFDVKHAKPGEGGRWVYNQSFASKELCTSFGEMFAQTVYDEHIRVGVLACGIGPGNGRA